MALVKCEIPILEYDDCQEAVIMPGRQPFKLPKKAVFAFLSDCVDEYAGAHDCPVIEEFESATKMYPVYRKILFWFRPELCGMRGLPIIIWRRRGTWRLTGRP